MIEPDVLHEENAVATWTYQMMCACGANVNWTFTGFLRSGFVRTDIEHRMVQMEFSGVEPTMLDLLHTASKVLYATKCVFPWSSDVLDWLVKVEL